MFTALSILIWSGLALAAHRSSRARIAFAYLGSMTSLAFALAWLGANGYEWIAFGIYGKQSYYGIGGVIPGIVGAISGLVLGALLAPKFSRSAVAYAFVQVGPILYIYLATYRSH